MTRAVSLRPAGFDELGLRRALDGRMLPFLVGAMAFLAALGLAGWVAAAALARHWHSGAAAALTIQVPRPTEDSRLDKVLALVQASPGITEAHALTPKELSALLAPWIGTDADTPALPLPGVIAAHLADPDQSTDVLARQLEATVPGTVVEQQGVWVRRLTTLARSVQAFAAAGLLVLAFIAAAVIVVATRAGLAARREAIEIVHGLGASDSYIAGRFAARTTGLAVLGGLGGSVAAIPALLFLAHLAAPFASGSGPDDGFGGLPPALWMLLPSLPLAAAAIGFATAQATVRRWLRRLP